jgi:hypothetical protein
VSFARDVSRLEHDARVDLVLRRIVKDGANWAASARIASKRADALPVAHFNGIAAGRYFFELSSTGLAPTRSSEFELVPGRLATIAFEVRAGRAVALRVVDTDGTPLNATLSAMNYTCLCDKDGRRTLDDLPWGPVTIEVSQKGFETQTVPIPPNVSWIPDIVLVRKAE